VNAFDSETTTLWIADSSLHLLEFSER